MGIESDLIRNLVDNVWPSHIAGIDIGLSKMGEQQTEIQNQIDAVEWSMDEAKTNQNSLIIGKGYSGNFYSSNYGVTNLSEFYCGIEISTSGLLYVDVDTFTVTGNQTSIFLSGLVLICNLGSSIAVRTVQSSVYTTVTTVTLESGTNLNSGLTNIFELEYSYNGVGWDSDTDIIENIDFFNDAYHHLNDQLTEDGTYGLYALKNNMDASVNVQQNNKAAYQNFISKYDRFGT